MKKFNIDGKVLKSTTVNGTFMILISNTEINARQAWFNFSSFFKEELFDEIFDELIMYINKKGRIYYIMRERGKDIYDIIDSKKPFEEITYKFPENAFKKLGEA